MFDLNGKVALITGGASGIGLETAKELLKNGAKGVTIADIQTNIGEQVVADLEETFGTGKAIFVKTDVTKKSDFENAFEQTIEKFNNVDILVNNAGMLDGIHNYEKEISVNVIGMTHGLVLGLDKYLLNHKSGEEGVILNVSSILGTQACAGLPIYCGTKFAIAGMTMSFGHKIHYDRTHIKVVGIAPGVTSTNLVANIDRKPSNLFRLRTLATAILQPVSHVATSIIEIIKEKESGTIWICKDNTSLVKYQHPIPPYEDEQARSSV